MNLVVLNKTVNPVVQPTTRPEYKAVHRAWPTPIPVMHADEAVTAAKRLYRFAMKKPWRGKVQLTSGNRHTWVRRGVLYVNPEQGWPRVVHSLSHYCFWRLSPAGARPHDAQQAYLERAMVEYVVKAGALDGKWRKKAKAVKPKPTTQDLQAKRAASVKARIERREAKVKRLTRELSKLRVTARYYERLGIQ